MNSNIETLIPHRHPFLFVDKIIVSNENTVIGLKTFDKKEDKLLLGSFPQLEFIPGMILVESMAQCGGAGIKLRGVVNGFFGLVSLENVVFLKGVTYGQEIKYIIKNISVGNRLIKQSGIAFVNNDPVAEATWVCAVINKSKKR